METFIKVYIKSEDDLPKEYGRYLTEFGWAKYDGSWTYSEMKGGGYLRDCYWYLKPVEIPEISDIINCILKFDESASLSEKGEYFEIIQRDLKSLKNNVVEDKTGEKVVSVSGHFETHTMTSDLLGLIVSWKHRITAPSMLERKIFKEVIKDLLRVIEKNKCPYCGRTEPCLGSYPEGCFHPRGK